MGLFASLLVPDFCVYQYFLSLPAVTSHCCHMAILSGHMTLPPSLLLLVIGKSNPSLLKLFVN